MELHAPVVITARLMAGLKIVTGDKVSWISVEPIAHIDNRTTYRWFVDGPDGQEVGTGDTLSVPGNPQQFVTVHEALDTLLTFLDMAGNEEDTEIWEILPEKVIEWAKANADAISEVFQEMREQG